MRQDNSKNRILQSCFIALFAAIISVGCVMSIPLPGGVPISLQNFFCILAGATLGGAFGPASVLIWMAAGAVGIPVFANAHGGIAILAGPTGGYIFGYLLGSLVAGIALGIPTENQRKGRLAVIKIAATVFVAYAIVYAPGIPWFMHVMAGKGKPQTFQAALKLTFIPFIPGDLIKFAVTIPLTLLLRPIAARYISSSSKSARDAEREALREMRGGKSAVSLKNVTKLFPGRDGGKKYEAALCDVSMEIERGSVTIVGGANGSGKSVLMQLISGLMEPTDGEITTMSKPGLVFQEAATQILGDTPREDVAVGPRNAGETKESADRIAEKALAEVRLLEKADIPAEFLSGGEKRRLAVASIIAMNRDILIFDEPYANLDYPGVLDVNRLIAELHEKGKTVIILTHELEKCLALADHFVILKEGKVVFDGKPEDALSQNLEQWSIRNPLAKYESAADLVWR